MKGNVVIRGCYSMAGKGNKLVGTNSTDFVLEKSETLVMSGDCEKLKNIVQIGNQIEIELDGGAYNREDSIWAEKTDRPYMDYMPVNGWHNMFNTDSNVFKDIGDSTEKEYKITINDPPTVTLGETRKLEFAIYLVGEGETENFLMLAKQSVKMVDEENKICKVKFKVYYCGFVRTSQKSESAVEELKEILKSYIDGDAGGKKEDMDTLVEYAKKIPEEDVSKVTVDYKTDELYEFNSWDESK